MKPNLLVEVNIRLRPLARVGIASIENAGAVGGPGGAAAAGRILHARDFVRQLPARIGLEEVQRPLLAAALRQRHRHQPPVR